ncbi:hypothetical protein [Nocardioides perillae]|uniref:Endonuclease/exonuclease/phosphatase domain-containing protein n=1 Tax=Nocardioides perillae TaxID=1119534 RepID=A0A7Y9RUV7_9ACTN|nr:hypothetical protein [Nocardioides perillae]NYG55771.1 hypothetical protein [Nocardioides perillae]
MSVPPAARPSRATSRAPRATLGRALRRGLRRGLAAGAVTAVAAGLLAGVGPLAGAPTALPDPSAPSARTDRLVPVAAAAPSPPFRTFSLNVAFPMGVAKARADMRKAMNRLGAAAGGFQEMSDAEDRQALIELCQELDWGWYMPVGQGVTIPVVFDRSRFRLIEGRSTKVHDAVGKNAPSRWINTVRLRETATGKVFGVINTHTIAQASRDAQASNPERIPYLRQHLAMLRVEIQDLFATTEHTVAMGDWNVNYLADRRRQVAGLPTRALGDLVNFDMPLVGSRGTRSLLDYIVSLKRGSGISRVDTRIVRGFNSDHDAVVATYAPVDVLAAGPLLTRPQGGVHDRRSVPEKWVRAIGGAEPGAVLSVATPRLEDAGVVTALLAAHARGVAVRVLLDGGARTEREQLLLGALGEDPAAASWLRAAVTDGPASRLSFLLADRTGGTTALAITGSTALDGTVTTTLADALLTSTDGLYAALLAAFDRLAVGGAPASPATPVFAGGGYQLTTFPVAGGDPVLDALAPVKCRRATGARNRDGRTQVRVSVNGFSGRRGAAIAERLAGKARLGCDVRVIAGPWTGRGVERTLHKAGVRVLRAPTTQTLLLVDGRYGRHADRQLTWTGSAHWGDSGLTAPAHTLRVVGEETLLAYRAQFDGRWARG